MEQEHIGVCLTTEHTALMPQVPMHGSWHFMLIHAILLLQFVFIVHSGIQKGGFPIYSGIQEQEAVPALPMH